MSYKNEIWLYDQYWNKGESLRNIAKKTKKAKSIIIYWFNKLGIPQRNKSQSIKNAWEQGKKMGYPKGYDVKRLRKEKHPNWNNIKEDACITKIHKFIERRKNKPKRCEFCKEEKRLCLSFNHSKGKHTREIEDYNWLCYKCHSRRDWNFGLMNNKYTKNKKEELLLQKQLQ